MSVWSCLVTAFPPGPKEERGARRASWREPMSVGYYLLGDVSVTLEGAVAPFAVFLEISEDIHLIGRAACRRPVKEKTSSLRALGNHRIYPPGYSKAHVPRPIKKLVSHFHIFGALPFEVTAIDHRLARACISRKFSRNLPL